MITNCTRYIEAQGRSSNSTEIIEKDIIEKLSIGAKQKISSSNSLNNKQKGGLIVSRGNN